MAKHIGMRFLLATLLLGGAVLSWAEGPRESGHDHDDARAALARGEVLPLATVLDQVARSHPGDVMAVELESEDGRWVYELKLLLRDGRLGKIDVDATTGEVIDMRVKSRRPSPPDVKGGDRPRSAP